MSHPPSRDSAHRNQAAFHSQVMLELTLLVDIFHISPSCCSHSSRHRSRTGWLPVGRRTHRSSTRHRRRRPAMTTTEHLPLTALLLTPGVTPDDVREALSRAATVDWYVQDRALT